MFNIIIRVLIIYVVVIALLRLMGKRQIGEMEPFELVITLIIADLATIPMAEQTIPLWYGIVPLVVICVIHFVASVLTKKSPAMRDILSGKPAVVIDPNGIVYQELKKLNISAEELLESLRNLNYFDLSEINYAIIERNGKISVIPKTGAVPATRIDMQIVKPENEMFYCIIENGKTIKKNFQNMGLRHESIISDILHHMLCNLSDIAFCAMNEGGDVYIQEYGNICKNFKIKIVENCYTKPTLRNKSENGEVVSTRMQQNFTTKSIEHSSTEQTSIAQHLKQAKKRGAQ